MPPIRRTIKNVVHNYTEAQVKVREATSNDPWGPSSTVMTEIADLTYNVMAFTEIMQMVWKRLNDHGKNWRHVYKALVLLEYLIKTGSEKVALQCKENIFAIQTLKDFQYIEENKDQGMNVREKAKQLVALLKDDEKLKNERTRALKAKERLAQNSSMGVGSVGGTYGGHGSHSHSDYGSPTSSPQHGANVSADLEAARPQTVGEEELQLQLALAMSKEEAEQQDKVSKHDDLRLKMALSESQDDFRQSPPPPTVKPEEKLPSLLDLDLSSSLGGSTSTDPWAPGATSTQGRHDPWGTQPTTNPVRANPFLSNVKSDPWSPTSNSANGELDGFDAIITSRQTGAAANGATNGAGDSTFHMNPVTGTLASTQGLAGAGGDEQEDKNKKKTAEEFLGENKKLVNLDSLISKPVADPATNPFAMTISPHPEVSSSIKNPFQEAPKPAVPMNQMRASPQNNSITPSADLFAPTLQSQDMVHMRQQPTTSYNPFL